MTEYNDISFTNDFVFCTVLRENDVSEKLKAFLKYIADGLARDSFSSRIESQVERIGSSEQWRINNMMTLEMKYKEIARNAQAEGITQGRTEGRKELIKQMLRVFSEKELIASGVSSEEIEAAKNGAVM